MLCNNKADNILCIQMYVCVCMCLGLVFTHLFQDCSFHLSSHYLISSHLIRRRYLAPPPFVETLFDLPRRVLIHVVSEVDNHGKLHALRSYVKVSVTAYALQRQPDSTPAVLEDGQTPRSHAHLTRPPT